MDLRNASLASIILTSIGQSYTTNAMSLHESYDPLYAIIGHTFTNRHLLKQALTAPGAEDDNYDGHRGYAQVGEFLLQFILGCQSFQTGSTRGESVKLLDMKPVLSDEKPLSMKVYALSVQTNILPLLRDRQASRPSSNAVHDKRVNCLVRTP